MPLSTLPQILTLFFNHTSTQIYHLRQNRNVNLFSIMYTDAGAHRFQRELHRWHSTHEAPGNAKVVEKPTCSQHPRLSQKDTGMKQPTRSPSISLEVRGRSVAAQSTHTLNRPRLLGLFFIKFRKPGLVIQESANAESKGCLLLLCNSDLSYRFTTIN